MTLVIPPGFAQASWLFSLEGDNEMMATTCGVDVGGFAGDFQAAAEAYSDAFVTAFSAAERADAYTYRGVVLRVGQDGGPPVIAEFTANSPGTLAVGPPPQNVAVLVRKSTGLGGRRGRGRMFLPPFCVGEEGIAANGILDGTTRSTLQTNVDAWFDGLAAVLLHDSQPTPVPAPTPITGFTVDLTVATQRRRLRR